MEKPGVSKGRSWLLNMALSFGVIGPIALIAVGAFYFSPERLALKKCDAAIQATLKAPSTFHRVSYDGYGVDGDYSFRISYDAANGFGVPIRGTGDCRADKSSSTAMWYEPPQI